MREDEYKDMFLFFEVNFILLMTETDEKFDCASFACFLFLGNTNTMKSLQSRCLC